MRAHPGNYLAEDYDVEAYYLRADVPWQRWSSTYYFRYQGARPGRASYEAAIGRHYFSLVILDFGDTAATDRQITADMRHAGGYFVLAALAVSPSGHCEGRRRLSIPGGARASG